MYDQFVTWMRIFFKVWLIQGPPLSSFPAKGVCSTQTQSKASV